MAGRGGCYGSEPISPPNFLEGEVNAEGSSTPRAPYLLCACSTRNGLRCTDGATRLRDGYGVCVDHFRLKKLKLHHASVPYSVLEPILGDQFSRLLKKG